MIIYIILLYLLDLWDSNLLSEMCSIILVYVLNSIHFYLLDKGYKNEDFIFSRLDYNRIDTKESSPISYMNM